VHDFRILGTAVLPQIAITAVTCAFPCMFHMHGCKLPLQLVFNNMFSLYFHLPTFIRVYICLLTLIPSLFRCTGISASKWLSPSTVIDPQCQKVLEALQFLEICGSSNVNGRAHPLVHVRGVRGIM